MVIPVDRIVISSRQGEVQHLGRGLCRDDEDLSSPLRVIGRVSNMVPFYEAYGVKPGDAMDRADSVRVQIW